MESRREKDGERKRGKKGRMESRMGWMGGAAREGGIEGKEIREGIKGDVEGMRKGKKNGSRRKSRTRIGWRTK